MSRRRLAVALVAATLVACGPSATPTSQADRAGSQAATAVALSKPAAVVTAIAAPPSPSPAGNKSAAVDGRIAIVREDGLVVVEGGQTRMVFRPPPGGQAKDPAWSPDGKSIAFAYAPPRPTPRAGAPIVEQLLNSDIMVVDADGNSPPKPAALHDGAGQILETPAWSGDGKSVLYSFYAPTYKGEELVSETLEVRRREIGATTSATAAKSASNPNASRDGKYLVVVGEDPNEGQSLKVIATGGGEERTLVKADRFVSLLAPRFSPDGQTIAFSAAELPTNQGGPQPKASAPLDLLRQALGPSVAEAHGLPWEIWTVPTAGGPLRQMTQIAEDTPYAAWSADGARILVFGAGGLHMVDAKAAQAQTLSSDGSHGGMDWRSGG